MSDILTELDEQMRAERMQKIWHDHHKTIIGVIAAIILGTALISGYKSWNIAQQTKGTNTLFTLLDDETFPNNITPDTPLTSMRPGLQAILLLNAAHGYVEQGQETDAIALYQTLITHKKAPGNLKDLARLMEVRVLGNQENADTQALITKLEKISKDSAYTPSATIQKALLYAGADNFEQAIKELETIKDTPSLPETIYLKAQSLSHVYTLKSSKKNDQK